MAEQHQHREANGPPDGHQHGEVERDESAAVGGNDVPYQGPGTNKDVDKDEAGAEAHRPERR